MTAKANHTKINSQTGTLTFEMGENDYFKQTIVDKRLFATTAIGGLKGNCWVSSMELWNKLKKTGAVRVRGTRFSDRVKNGNPHYWVENKGMIFENYAGIQQITNKDLYYREMEVQDVEYATLQNGFFNSELDAWKKTDKQLQAVRKLLVKGICPDKLVDLLIYAYKQEDELEFKREAAMVDWDNIDPYATIDKMFRQRITKKE